MIFFGRNKRTAVLFVLVSLFVAFVVLNISLYKTWGNNEHSYWITETHLTECDMVLFQPPANCRTKAISDWCGQHGGEWDPAARECSDIPKRSCDLIAYYPPILDRDIRCLDTSEPPCDTLEKSDYYVIGQVTPKFC